MKKISIFVLGLLTLVACSENEQLPRVQQGGPLVLVPQMTSTRAAATNYTVGDYFAVNDRVEVTLGTNSYNYVYQNSVLVAATPTNAHYYPTMGKLPDLTVKWPVSSLRATFPTNQSTKENFLMADWLSYSEKQITITDRLPVELSHENCVVIFTVAGARQGTKIERIIWDAYLAYCPQEAGYVDAMLMVRPEDNPLEAGGFGMVKLAGESSLRPFELTTMPQLTAGASCVVTITLN